LFVVGCRRRFLWNERKKANRKADKQKEAFFLKRKAEEL